VNILVCPTAFKGTFSPSEAAAMIARGVRRKWPAATVETLPLADGGDGTLEVLLTALKGRMVTTRVRGPLNEPVSARWALVGGGHTAVIEMARASGLALLKGRNRILQATSYGTGQLIKAALARGCRQILIGVGGTACAEGGAGALEALGLKFFDGMGRSLSSRPVELARVARIDESALDARLKKIKLRVLCDVTNPLLGRRGSARTFGPQKGATPAQVKFLENMLIRWSRFAPRDTKNKPGAGAAGALAFGLSGFAGASLEPGTRFVMNAVGWNQRARKADLLITGEGRLDKTSFQGKVLAGVLARRGRAQVMVVCGENALTKSEWRRHGVSDVFLIKEFL
jgi:glycerate kinase